MNTDKIVVALRELCQMCDDYAGGVCGAAADLVEYQAAQLTALQAKYDKLNDFEQTQSAKLLARLAETETRERAAVADLVECMSEYAHTCKFCGNGTCTVRGGTKKCDPKWARPAGRGGAG